MTALTMLFTVAGAATVAKALMTIISAIDR